MVMDRMTPITRASRGMYILNRDVSTGKARDLILMIIPSKLRENFSLVLLVMSISKMKMAFIPKAAERHLRMLSRNRIRRVEI
ncbi:hypothetical protein MANES_11G017475v8 [Manihot esculenta]|uniref:Uncharacterized protein n=1 Tax=Manihot esculenta TaxID=3983 RepID=A0ACB7GTA7_MANES|nr:hypothetical protein MANES_11G017475v8 [Manihot esculenta]